MFLRRCSIGTIKQTMNQSGMLTVLPVVKNVIELLIICMLRITRLLRTNIPKTTPLRAGLPGWHRPDPPPSAHVPIDHELSDEEIVFTFFDGSMPEHILTQPEVYEGDTVLQATPMFAKGLGVWVGFAVLVGSVLYLTNPLRKDPLYRPQVEQRVDKEFETVNSKKWLKEASKNELGIELTSEMYPQFKQGKTAASENFFEIKKQLDSVSAIDAEIKKFFTTLKAKSQEKVQKKLSNPEGHSHDSHASHHHH